MPTNQAPPPGADVDKPAPFTMAEARAFLVNHSGFPTVRVSLARLHETIGVLWRLNEALRQLRARFHDDDWVSP